MMLTIEKAGYSQYFIYKYIISSILHAKVKENEEINHLLEICIEICIENCFALAKRRLVWSDEERQFTTALELGQYVAELSVCNKDAGCATND